MCKTLSRGEERNVVAHPPGTPLADHGGGPRSAIDEKKVHSPWRNKVYGKSNLPLYVSTFD